MSIKTVCGLKKQVTTMLLVHSAAEACLFGLSPSVILTRCRGSISEEQEDIHDKLILTSSSGNHQS